MNTTENFIKCTKCGLEIENNHSYCSNCGHPTNDNIQQTYIKENKLKAFLKKYGKSFIILNIIMTICFVISLSMFSKGHDKITNYYNSEDFPSLNENAYVGGDAYNYIINGNYATGYYVLGTGFMLAGTMCGCTSLILKNKQDNIGDSNEKNN